MGIICAEIGKMGKRTGKPRGRPSGAKSKHTREREERIAEAAAVIEELLPDAFKGDAHALLIAVYKDTEQPMNTRLDAAKAAIGYEKPRLAAVEHKGDPENPVHVKSTVSVDRPPRESRDDWIRRRASELSGTKVNGHANGHHVGTSARPAD